jgi:predicted O-methyltransferase YrrM
MLYVFNGGVRYELQYTLWTIRKEGFRSLPGKVLTYFRHLGRAMRFFTLRMPHGAPPDEVVDFTLKICGKLIAPTQERSEILQLATLIHQRKPKTVVEIGTEKDGTLAIWCCVADAKATIVSIDLPGGMFGGGYPGWRTSLYRRFAQPAQTLHLLRKDSHLTQTRDELKALLPVGGIDYLFIDGDHTYKGVKQDFEIYSPLVRSGGLVVFHDICTKTDADNQVPEFWREIRTKHKSWEYLHNPDQTMYGIGVLEL